VEKALIGIKNSIANDSDQNFDGLRIGSINAPFPKIERYQRARIRACWCIAIIRTIKRIKSAIKLNRKEGRGDPIKYS
jgi:hypothetical protein